MARRFFRGWFRATSRRARKGRPVREQRVRRLWLERLEDRTLPSQISWANPAGGNWDDDNNWVGGKAPGTGDTALIDTASDATITIQSGDAIQVQAVTTGSHATLSIAGGSLTVTAGTSTLDGPLTMAAGTLTATGSGGVTLTANGATTATGTNLQAQAGASLSLPHLTTYTTDGIFGNDNLIADGSGSVLDVSALTTVTQDGSWAIYATNGGTVNLGGLTSLDGGSHPIFLTDTGGSDLVLNAAVTTPNAVYAALDGAGAAIASSWTKFTNGSLTVTGGTVSLLQLTDVDDSSLYVQNGASLTLSKLTSYASDNNTFQADGAGSVLDVSALTTLPTQGFVWTVEATNGGTLDLTGLASIGSPGFILLTDTGGSSLELNAGITTLNGVAVTLDEADVGIASSWTQLTNGGLTVIDGSVSLPNLTHIDGTSLLATDGATLALPGITSYASDNNTFQADGSGSVLDVSALTTITYPSNFSHDWTVEATNGGTLDLSGLTTLGDHIEGLVTLTDTGGSTLLDAKVATLDGVNATLDDSDSQVAASWTALTNGSLTITNATLELTALPGGKVSATGGTLNLPKLTDFTNSDLEIGAGVFECVVTVTNGASISVQGSAVSLPAAGTSGGIVNVPAFQADPGTDGLVVVLHNTGTLTNTTVNVGAGSTVAMLGGTYMGTTTFNVGAGATVDVSDRKTEPNAPTYGGTLTGSGAGTVALRGGDLFAAVGGVTLNFAGGVFQWTDGGFFTGLGDITNQGTVNLAGDTEMFLYGDGTLDNFGSLVQTGKGNFGIFSDGVGPTTFINESGASYLIESDAGLDNFFGSGIANLDNAGTIRKTAGTQTSTVYVAGTLSNAGTIEADTGTLALRANTISQVVSHTLRAGTWAAEAGTTLAFPAGTAITASAANLILGGAGASIIGIAGLASNSGGITLGAGAGFTTAGDFANSGRLTVGPGATFGVSGNYTQSAAGALSIQLGGTPASGQFGRVGVTATAALAGDFTASLVNGYSPDTGQDFPVVTGAVRTGTFASLHTVAPFFTAALNPTSFDLVDGASYTADLVTDTVTAPTTATAGQSITVSWQASDPGSQPITGSWQDTVYLSTTPEVTVGSGILGTVTHTGGLDAGGSYDASWTGSLPQLPPGPYYILVQTDSLDQVPDPDRANNIQAAKDGAVQVSLPSLTLGVPYADAFTAAGQDRYYQLTVSQSETLVLTLNSGATTGQTALYVGEGYLPATYDYDFAATATQPNQSLSIPLTDAATYYVLAHSVAGAAATSGYQLLAQFPGLRLQSVSPNFGGNTGKVTVALHGTDLTDATVVTLTRGGTTLTAVSTVLSDPSLLLATFDLTGAGPGAYDVNVADPGSGPPATLPGAFTVEPGRGGNLSVSLQMPSEIRAGRQAAIQVSYANTGDDDLTLPFISVTDAQGGSFSYLPDGMQDAGQITFLAPPLVSCSAALSPGASGVVQLYYTPANDQGPVFLQLSADTLDDPVLAATPLDWTGASQALRPPGVSDQSWNDYVAANQARYGNTYGDLYHFLTGQIQTFNDPQVTQEIFVDGRWEFTVRPQDVLDQTAVRGINVTPTAGNPPPPDFKFDPVPSLPPPDVTLPPTQPSDQVGQPFVVIIGDDYAGTGFELPGVDRDVNALNNLFKNGYNLPASQVQTVKNKPGSPLTPDQIKSAIQNATQGKGPNDTVIIFMEGHGVPDGMLLSGGNDVESLDHTASFGLLSPGQLNQDLGGASCPTYFIDDQCYSGAVTNEISAPNVIPVSSATGSEPATDGGSFTQALIDAFQQNPFGNLQDILNSAAAKFRARHPNQHPQIPHVNGPMPSIPSLDFKEKFEKGVKLKFRGGASSDVLRSIDPNALIGPAGYGTPGFIQPGGAWSYSVEFENDGTAAAQGVTVTEQLDADQVAQQLPPDLDWSTFQLGSFGFGSAHFAVPAGLTQYLTVVPYRNSDGTDLNVAVSLDFNVQTGVLTATFTSIDPVTGKAPDGVLEGFLPPDNTAGIGEGFVQFTVRPKSGLATGTAVSEQASVVFDTNDPLPTATVVNTIDAGPPTSSVHALPATTTSTSFNVSWSGHDDPNGSGIASYTIYVAVDGGAFTPWLTDTTLTSSTYAGALGHRYAFYSVATDNVGNVQPTPTAAQASTLVGQPAKDVTGSVSIRRGTLHRVRGTTHFTQTITVQNKGKTALAGPLELVFNALQAQGGGAVTLLNLSGTTAAGSPYVTLPVGTSGLAAHRSVTITVTFDDPSLKTISYSPRVESGPGIVV